MSVLKKIDKSVKNFAFKFLPREESYFVWQKSGVYCLAYAARFHALIAKNRVLGRRFDLTNDDLVAVLESRLQRDDVRPSA